MSPEELPQEFARGGFAAGSEWDGAANQQRTFKACSQIAESPRGRTVELYSPLTNPVVPPGSGDAETWRFVNIFHNKRGGGGLAWPRR